MFIIRLLLMTYVIITVDISAISAMTCDFHKNLDKKNGFIFGLGAAALLLARWFFSESDIQLIARAQKISEEAYKKYEPMMNFFEREYHFLEDPMIIEQKMRSSTEQEIYDRALILWQSDIRFGDYNIDLLRTITQLSSVLYTLDNRQHELEKTGKYSHESREILEQLYRFIRHVLLIRENLNLIKRYFAMHITYFDLFEGDGNLRNKYQTPISYVENFSNDPYECSYKIREWALSDEMHAISFHQIVGNIRSDINDLQKKILNTNPTYQHRITTAQQLRDTLKYIKSLLTIDPLYTQETAAQEWQQIHNK